MSTGPRSRTTALSAKRIVAAVIMSGSVLVPVRGAEIQGTVQIERRLTRPRVTAAANAYARGVSVRLHSGLTEDALAFERSHVAIYLDGPVTPKPLTGSVEQKDRQFFPDMLVVPAGSTVSFPNLDPIFHNVFSLSKAKEFDLGNYPKGRTRTVTFSKPGIVFVNCHLHANMAAVILITPNQWSARPGEDGRFRLSDVPPGTYTIVAWHKAAGFFRQQIIVTEDGAAPVSFFIPLAAQTSEAAQ
ncbi:MAG TPA: hypothetical protein VKT49_11650 [Bryobacteraceae bacterium]|nr:hypothetical protein [Bryobacteraceae bacterium]